MALEVRIDADMCMGIGSCIALAPSSFRWNDTRSQGLVRDPTADDEETLRAAVRNCPNFAISVTEGLTVDEVT